MKHKMIVSVAAVFAVLAVFTGCAKKAKKADFPTKNITVICPWAAGGGTDAILRAVVSAAEKNLGVTMTVENKTGGGGAIGHAAI